jgi:DNA-binding MarR family transcriptional regulator
MTMATRKSKQAASGPTPQFRSVGFMLSTLGYAVSRAFHHALAPVELEPSEFAVMRGVGFNEGQSQQTLAKQLRISPSRMVAIVDRLEERELLERRPHPSDRRAHNLHLTPRGQGLLAQAFRLAKQHEQRISGPLTAAERAQLLDLLDRMAEALDLPPGAHAALREV